MNSAVTDSRESVLISPQDISSIGQKTPTQDLSPFRRKIIPLKRAAPSREEMNESLLTASDGIVEGDTNFASLLTRSNINVTSPSAWMESPIPVNKGLADEVESDYGFAEIGENSMNLRKEVQEEKQDELIEEKSNVKPSRLSPKTGDEIKAFKYSPQKPQNRIQKRRFQQSEQPRKRAKIAAKSNGVVGGGPYAKYFRQQADFYEESLQTHVDELKQLFLTKLKARDEEQNKSSLDMSKLKSQQLKIKARLIEQTKQAQYEKERGKINAAQMAKRMESHDKLEAVKARGLQLMRENIRMKTESKRLKEKIGARAKEKRKETFYKLYQALLPGVNFRPNGGDKLAFETKGLRFVINIGECSLQCMNIDQVSSEKVGRLFEHVDNATIKVETMQELRIHLKFLFRSLKAQNISEDSSTVASERAMDQEPVLE